MSVAARRPSKDQLERRVIRVMPSLRLLTTHHLPANRLFTTTNATSAATAQRHRPIEDLVPLLYPGVKVSYGTIQHMLVEATRGAVQRARSAGSNRGAR